ncbi:MAG: hypothetical protein AAF442_09015 [Pseudomonadota bacterium]
MRKDVKILNWDKGRAEVQLLGAMLAPARLTLPDGRTVQPFAIAPWANEPPKPGAPPMAGVLARLRGEWPCVPFGAAGVPPGLPPAWQPTRIHKVGTDFHGWPANNPWDVIEESATRVRLRSIYPAGEPLERLERTVEGVAGSPALQCSLTIVAREDISVTAALHPTLAVPNTPNDPTIEVIPSDFDFGYVYPITLDGAPTPFALDQVFTSLTQVPGADGGVVDGSRMPFRDPAETLVQLCGHRGPIRVANHRESYGVEIAYDVADFPSVQIWYSLGGRTQPPWRGRFRAVGIEPVCGAFDLGSAVGSDGNQPIAARGIPTALFLRAGQVWQTHYRLSVYSL